MIGYSSFYIVGDWLTVAKPVIEQRISRYAADEIHFNLMAIVSDKIIQAEQKIQVLTEVSCLSIDLLKHMMLLVFSYLFYLGTFIDQC